MGRKAITEVNVHRSDLWEGASDRDVEPVVAALRARDIKAYRVRDGGQSTIGDCLAFATLFYDTVLASLADVVAVAERSKAGQVANILLKEQARLENARAARDRFQAEVASLEARLDELVKAAEAFERLVNNTDKHE